MAKISVKEAKAITKAVLKNTVGFSPMAKEITDVNITDKTVTFNVGGAEYSYEYTVTTNVNNFHKVENVETPVENVEN
jgi:hypothetical protein